MRQYIKINEDSEFYKDTIYCFLISVNKFIINRKKINKIINFYLTFLTFNNDNFINIDKFYLNNYKSNILLCSNLSSDFIPNIKEIILDKFKKNKLIIKNFSYSKKSINKNNNKLIIKYKFNFTHICLIVGSFLGLGFAIKYFFIKK